MKTKELFLRATALCPMEIHEFIGHLGDAVRALLARYPTSLLAAGDGEIAAPRSLEEECGLHPLYSGALILGVLAGKRGEATARTAFLEEADAVYRALWRRAAVGCRHTAGGRWR